MRRVCLLILAAAVGSWMFTLFWGRIGNRDLPAVSVVATPSQAAMQEVWQLPQKVQGTDLLAHSLGVYDGPFMEDGSGEEVIGITALVLENTGDSMIEKGEVILKSNQGDLTFSFSMLPPGAKILIPEGSRQKLRPAYFTSVSGFGRILEGESLADRILIEERDMITLVLTNIAEEETDQLTLIFKTIDSPSEIWIGGNIHEVSLPILAPGETVEISPYGYVQGYTKVVAIIKE